VYPNSHTKADQGNAMRRFLMLQEKDNSVQWIKVIDTDAGNMPLSGSRSGTQSILRDQQVETLMILLGLGLAQKKKSAVKQCYGTIWRTDVIPYMRKVLQL
jgi:hypothetical protein